MCLLGARQERRQTRTPFRQGQIMFIQNVHNIIIVSLMITDNESILINYLVNIEKGSKLGHPFVKVKLCLSKMSIISLLFLE